jgi:hypothetical protein
MYCFLSFTVSFFLNVNRFFSLYIIFYYSRESFCLLPYENHLQRKKIFSISLPLHFSIIHMDASVKIIIGNMYQPLSHTKAG